MSPGERRVLVPSPQRVTLREIQLVDRDEEMQVLREAADRAAHGEGGVVFLHGEAGIGKTRLARELGAYARSRGIQVLSGRCPALFRVDGVPPYVLWKEVIKDYLETCTPEQLYRVVGSYPIEVSKLIPKLKQKLRLVPESFPLSPEHSRVRLFEAVTQFITNISREKPLLIILDDLQWTDQSSLLLMHYLARGIYRESLLLLGAYRDTYVDKKHPLSPVLAELNRERLLQSLSLKRMSFDDVSEMIRRILDQDNVSKEFCRLVYEKTRGNPFFVEEVVKSLKEEKVIYREKNKWKFREVSEIEFPKTVKDVIKARLSRLDDECQRVLTLASFIGKDFTFKALREVTEFEEDKLLELIEKMLKTGLIKESLIRGEDVFSFVDIIVRNVVHDEVSRVRRRKLHGVVGSALEKVCAKKIDEHLGELALHFLESGDEDKALDYFLRAGEKAAKVYANSEAASYFQSAYKLLEEKEGECDERGRLLERLGDIKCIVGENDACLKYWDRALLLWERLRDKQKVARLHRKMAGVLFVMGDQKKAKEYINKALKILEAEPESVELAEVCARMAGGLYASGDMTEALPWAEKALELAKKLNDSEAIASSYVTLGTCISIVGDPKKGSEYLERALKLALDNGHVEIAISCYINLGSLLSGEENERRLECGEKGFELAKKVGNITGQSWFGINLADMYTNMGNISRAKSLAEKAVALDRKAGNLANLSMSIMCLAHTYQITGEWNKGEQYLREALSISQKMGVGWSAECYATLGWFHLSTRGKYIKARENLEKALEICEKAGAKYEQMWYSRFLIWTYIELGEIEKAKNLIDNLHKFSLETEDKEFIATTDALRAMMFRAQKKWKESIEHFEKSLQKHEALGARRWDVYRFAKMVLSEYARAYLERDHEGDREKACNLLNQALEIFQKIGAKKDIERTKSRMRFVETGREIVEPEPVAEIALPSHITTGYEELDNMLFGGIPRDYAVILTSLSFDEKDLLIKRFLKAGAKEGQTTFYITTKASGVKNLAEEFRSNFYLLICNPQADKIIKDMPNVFKLKGVENLNDINIALSSAFRKLDTPIRSPRRICIEIISDVLLQHHAVSTRRWLNALIPELKSKGFTTLAVMDPGMHTPQEVRAVLGLFDGETSIYEKETERGLEKFLKIKKMTNQKYSKSDLSLQEEKLQE